MIQLQRFGSSLNHLLIDSHLKFLRVEELCRDCVAVEDSIFERVDGLVTG